MLVFFPGMCSVRKTGPVSSGYTCTPVLLQDTPSSWSWGWEDTSPVGLGPAFASAGRNWEAVTSQICMVFPRIWLLCHPCLKPHGKHCPWAVFCPQQRQFCRSEVVTFSLEPTGQIWLILRLLCGGWSWRDKTVRMIGCPCTYLRNDFQAYSLDFLFPWFEIPIVSCSLRINGRKFYRNNIRFK